MTENEQREQIAAVITAGRILKHSPELVAEDLQELGYRKVERGEWILIANGLVCRWQCTVCGYETWDAADSDTDFCPCCGADMRGEGK